MLCKLLSLMLALAVLALQSEALGRMQSAAVTGRVTCHGKPEVGLKVKLYDHDTFTPSDRMGQTVTAPDGSFHVSGHKTEFTNIVPELRIYHKCGHFFFRHCSKIRIPNTYVTAGPSPQKVYEAGNIKLETMTSNC